MSKYEKGNYPTAQFAGKSLLQCLTDFHDKFNIPYNGEARMLDSQEQRFRNTCHNEEIAEYLDAVEFGRHATTPVEMEKALADQLDALVDLVYFAIGTCHRQGLDFDEAFLRVHAANMAKEVNPKEQRRGWEMEITKPTDWKEPDLSDLVTQLSTEVAIKEPAIPKVSKRIADEHLVASAPALTGEFMGKYKGLITLDGVDCAGKTTLAKRIAELTGGEYIHLTWTPDLDNVMDAYRANAIRYAGLLATDRVVILERPWLSYPIYADVYRDGGKWADYVEGWKHLTEEYEQMCIIAIPSNRGAWLELYLEMCEKREELHGADTDKIGQVYDGFVESTQGSDRYPMAGCVAGKGFNVYDFQRYHGGVVEVDGFIKECVLPSLTKK